MSYFIAAVLGYLLGSSNMAMYLALLKRVDLRVAGSGNLGASNAAILMGWGAGIAVALHDLGKALAAVLLAAALFPASAHIGAVAGVAAVLGHIFPFYLKFRGGKGFASYLGVVLALDWKFALILMAAVLLITLLADYLVLGTFTTITVTPLYLGITARSFVPALILLVASAVILYKHRENITRLRNGTEIGLRSTAKGEHRVK